MIAAAACTDGHPKLSEPVKTQKVDDDAGYNEGGDAAGGEAAGGDAFDGAADSAAPAQDAPAAAPAPEPKKPSGGIISSGVKAKPGDECKKLKSKKAQKDCFAHAKKARQN